MKYLNKLMRKEQLEQNTLIVSPTGSGKTHYIINHLCKNKKTLYLCDNNNLEEQVLLEENTKSVKKNVLNKGFSNNITVATYKRFGSIIKKDLKETYINNFDLIVGDEIHNLISYYNMDKDVDLSHAIKALMKTYNNTKIVLFTATPYDLDILAKNNEGIDENYKRIDFTHHIDIKRYVEKDKKYISNITQIKFILLEHKEKFIKNDLKALIYTNKIADMQYIEEACTELGIKAVSIWSKNNLNFEMSKEQQRVRQHLVSTGELYNPYNVLIINRATETGVNIIDRKMNLVIINTINLTQQIQARGRVRKDIDLLIVKSTDNKKADLEIEYEFLNKPLLKEDLQTYINKHNLKIERGRKLTVNRLLKLLENNGYKVTKTRKIVEDKKNTFYIIKKGQ